jgi:peptidyl-prolyl cis-trans isomerase C
MSKTLMKLSAAAIALFVAFPVAAQEEITADTVIASVNGKDITFGHMLMARASLPERFDAADTTELWDGLLEQLIQQETLSQSDKATETNRMTIALANERRSLLAAEAIQVVAKDALTEEALLAAYEAKYQGQDPEVEFNASHILVETEEEAQAVIVEIEGGADFAETAMAKSTGPSGPRGGLLGWFGKGRMVPAFEQAVTEMVQGTVSAPVQTQFGWHVIRLNETRTAAAPPLETVRAELSQQIQREAVQSYIDGMMEDTDVTRIDRLEIDTSVLNDIDLLEN